MTALQPYPAYRDSGVDWLGEVPEHWDMRRVGTVADLRVSNVDKHVKEGEQPVRLCNYVDVYHNERISPDVPFMVGTAGRREIRRFRLAVGDVLVTKDSEDWTDIGVPALVEYAADDLVCGYHLAMLRPNRTFLDGGYLFQALRDSRLAWQFRVAATGVTRYGLSHNAIRSMRIPLPPLSEQTAIARFLDHADRRIQRYIRVKERLIELLEEQKQAIIHQAVTGQIDVRTGQPYPAYEDSGMEWLGEVPEHWALSRVKGEFQCLNRNRVPLSSVERGKMTSRRYDYYGASGIIDKVDDYLFDDELLLIAEDGANLVMRNLPLAIIARGKFWVNNHAHILKPRRGNIEFLEWVMEGLNYLPWISGAAQPKLTQDRLMGIAIAVPPRDEQDEVMALLKDETVQLADAVTHAHQEIALAREYRTRLISDVVTGKLDVREAAAALPDVDSLASRDTSDELAEGYADLAVATAEPHP